MTGPRVRLAITVGDPAGIGPEIIAKALARSETLTISQPIVVGAIATMRRALRQFAPNARAGAELRDGPPSPEVAWYWHDIDSSDSVDSRDTTDIENRVRPGSAEAGRDAYLALEVAARLALAGTVDGIVTAPINKEALALHGFRGVGHTELLADLCAVPRSDVAMLLASETLRVAHVSTHVSLRDAVESLAAPRIIQVAKLASDAVSRDLGRLPRLAVAGLNPHAGEGGLFGSEELDVIMPAVEQMKALGLNAKGPFPPDTVFLRALKKEFDVVIAMYHDQGHIPSKIVGFEDTVNVTLGLPILRTSVDHGTAYDIAWQGVANDDNLMSAIRAAARMSRERPEAQADE